MDKDIEIYKNGDRVWVAVLKKEATVIEQILDHDFYGNVKLKYDDGSEGISHRWLLSRAGK